MKIKRTIAAVFTVMLCVGAWGSMELPTPTGTQLIAQADGSVEGTYRNLTYYIVSMSDMDPYIEISQCSTSASGVMTIPSEIDGIPVTTIWRHAFSGCTKLTEVVVPESVNSIGYKAFDGCSALKKITIENANCEIVVEGMENTMDYNYTYNGELTISETAVIEGYAGSTAESYAKTYRRDFLDIETGEVTSPTVLTLTVEGQVSSYVVANALWDANAESSDIKEVVIKGNPTIIESDAFFGFDNLLSITIPESVNEIYNNAFDDCPNLTTITVDEKNQYYADISGVLFSKDITALVKYPQGKDEESWQIPNGVTTISAGAFEGCTSLTSITIPEGVTSIGWYAFNNCTSLASITIPESVTDIGFRAFSETPWLAQKREENPLVIVNGILIDGLTCTGDVTIPESVTSIGTCAFEYCTGLTSITIPESVASIGDYAFSRCTNLSTITIPDSVVSIGAEAFRRTPWVASKQEENPMVIVNGILIDGTTCTGDVTIPESVTSIGASAFAYCEGLTSITIPESVTSIGDYAFGCCTNLSTITIPESVTSIGYSAFTSCKSLTSIVIPEGVTSIGESTFDYCTSLTSITIPDSVTYIGYRAFFSCPMTDVYYMGTEEEWVAIVIDYLNSELNSAAIHYNSIAPDTTTPVSTKHGDINLDGTVNVLDVIFLNKNLLTGAPLTEQGILNADVDDDGAPTAADSLIILKSIVNLAEIE